MRMAELVSLPTVIIGPGLYKTRKGEVVTITEVSKGWATGHYPCNTPEKWDVSGRLLPFSLSDNDITESAMIAAKNYPAPGTEVGAERWPYDHAHPDCWLAPHKGVVLPLNDVRAWHDTLAFPASMYPDGPPQDKVTAHVEKCLAEGLLSTSVPVLYTSSIDGKTFLQWDSKVRPYAEDKAAWEAAREEKRKQYN